jgi:hypothetical protein
MDKAKFDSKVSARGLKYGYIARSLGISEQALTKKRHGSIPFKVSEIKVLKSILELTDKEISDIFL